MQKTPTAASVECMLDQIPSLQPHFSSREAALSVASNSAGTISVWEKVEKYKTKIVTE